MMPQARPRPPRPRGWLGWLRRRRNRRVRLVGRRLPSPSSLLARASAWVRGLGRPAAVLAIAVVAGGAGFGVHRLVTRSPHFAVRELRFSTTKQVSNESLAA